MGRTFEEETTPLQKRAAFTETYDAVKQKFRWIAFGVTEPVKVEDVDDDYLITFMAGFIQNTDENFFADYQRLSAGNDSFLCHCQIIRDLLKQRS